MDAEDEGPSVLEYARFHGLCRDYTQEPHLHDLNMSWVEYDDSDDLVDFMDTLPSDLSERHTKERLNVPKEALFFIQGACTASRPRNDPILAEPDRHQVLRLKLDVPILCSDEELDMHNFGSTEVPRFNDANMPIEPTSVDEDGGLDWPKRYYAYSAKLEKSITRDKLTVTKETLLFIQEALKDTYTEEDGETLDEAAITYHKNTAMEPITPPLLPITPPITPYIPSSPGNNLELLSESSGSVMRELKSLEEYIMKDDAVLLPTTNRTDSDTSGHMLLDSGLEGIVPNSQSPLPDPALPKRKIQDLRVEGPLTPPILSQSPEKKLKSVSFPEMLHEYIPDVPSEVEPDNDGVSCIDDAAAFFDEIGSAVDEVNQKLENEKLSEVDTTRRVPVPGLHFPTPMAPWDEFKKKTQGRYWAAQAKSDIGKEFLAQICRKHLQSASTWRGIGTLDRTLTWGPFPKLSLSKVATQEQLQANELLPRLFEELSIENTADSSSLVWKPEGLRLLDNHTDSDDDIDPAEFSEPEVQDMEALLKKRKLEMEPYLPIQEQQLESGRPKRLRAAVDTPKPVGKKRLYQPLPSMAKSRMHAENGDNSLMFGGFSASEALSKFMATNGREVKQAAAPEASTNPGPSRWIPPDVRLGPRQGNAIPAHRPKPTHILSSSSQKVAKPLALPPLPETLPPTSFIISSTLLQHHNLIRLITKHHPTATFIDRDFSLPHSLAVEADVLLSPSTGLVLTTLQQIKQRALPGQPQHSPIKEKILGLEVRFERVVVLVSQGLVGGVEVTEDDATLGAHDSVAVEEFQDWAAKCEADVMVKYVPGGEDWIARAVVGAMSRWGIEEGSGEIGEGFGVLEEETLWELFLRRLGLNAYAAQAILYILRKPRTIQLGRIETEISTLRPTRDTAQVSGLPVFVLMPQEERVRRFQALLGGSRILERVGRSVDMRWFSAADGFRGV